MNIFLIFVLTQVVVISVILFVLKKTLNRNLVDLAIKQIEAGQLKQDAQNVNITVTTHKPVSTGQRERLLKAVTKQIPGAGTPDFKIDGKLLGGMIIEVGPQIVDYSLIDRLRKAR